MMFFTKNIHIFLGLFLVSCAPMDKSDLLEWESRKQNEILGSFHHKASDNYYKAIIINHHSNEKKEYDLPNELDWIIPIVMGEGGGLTCSVTAEVRSTEGHHFKTLYCAHRSGRTYTAAVACGKGKFFDGATIKLGFQGKDVWTIQLHCHF